MKRLLDYINNNVLLKIASLNSVSVLIRVIAGFLTSKAIAVFVGAEGLALIGNLRNFVTTVQSLSTLGLYNGAVKYISEFRNSVNELKRSISTVFYLGLLATIITSIVCYFKADYINNLIFTNQYNYTYIIKILAISLPFYSLNIFCLSILNGFSKYKMLIYINSISQVLSVAITLLLIYNNKIDGALVAVVISESLILIVTLTFVFHKRHLSLPVRSKYISLNYLKKMSSYSVMTLFSAIALPMVYIMIRSYIIDNLGYKEAGFWEAITRISKYYLMFISTLLGLYILPRFSEIDNTQDFRKEVFGFYKTIMPIFGLGLILIFLFKSHIVTIIFTKEFKPVEALFLWQLLGDFIKVFSLVIAYQFLAKKMFWHYILTETFSVTILYIISIYFIDKFGVKGATIAHFFTSLINFGLVLFIFRNFLFGKLAQVNQNND